MTQARDVIQNVASPHAHMSSEVLDYSLADEKCRKVYDGFQI